MVGDDNHGKEAATDAPGTETAPGPSPDPTTTTGAPVADDSPGQSPAPGAPPPEGGTPAAEPAKAEPAKAEPAPTQSAPSEPAMAEPAPQATASPEPAPAEPAPAEPAPQVPPEPDWKEQHEKTRNQLLRVAADFENYKKRSKRDQQDAAHRARDEILQELLPVIDNLERAIGHATTAGNDCVESMVEGVQMVLRTFQSGMERFGVKGFEAVGQAFDPNLHEALSQRPSEDVPPGTIVEEYRRGYLLGDRLLRPALVVVASAPPAQTAPTPAETAPASAESAPATAEAAPATAETAPTGPEADSAKPPEEPKVEAPADTTTTQTSGDPAADPRADSHGGGSPEESR